MLERCFFTFLSKITREEENEMITIICEVIGASAMIIVALISKNTNKKVNKFTEIKEEFKSEITKVSHKIDNNEKDYLRFQILSFAGDLRNRYKKDTTRI